MNRCWFVIIVAYISSSRRIANSFFNIFLSRRENLKYLNSLGYYSKFNVGGGEMHQMQRH